MTVNHPFGSFLPVDSERYRSFQVFQIRVIAAHRLARGIRKLCNRSAVDILELDNDVQRGLAGIVRYKRADTEGNLGSAAEIVVQLLGTVKIKTVAEKKELCL